MSAIVHVHLSTLLFISAAVWFNGIVVGAVGIKLITMGKKWS